mmetsp:Transcript_18307/g.31714  ORF Transcript_18307/g.31714 Transcript_18307/m.31714 type:complete len:187 (+) Transcript_18307:762-1322(+)
MSASTATATTTAASVSASQTPEFVESFDESTFTVRISNSLIASIASRVIKDRRTSGKDARSGSAKTLEHETQRARPSPSDANPTVSAPSSSSSAFVVDEEQFLQQLNSQISKLESMDFVPNAPDFLVKPKNGSETGVSTTTTTMTTMRCFSERNRFLDCMHQRGNDILACTESMDAFHQCAYAGRP